MSEITRDRQMLLDAFYWRNGKCCAGCDWWQHVNSMVGECTRSAPVSGRDRYSMLGFEGWSARVGAGHVMTKRDHVCGDFKDEFDWMNLSPWHLRLIGHPKAPTQETEG